MRTFEQVCYWLAWFFVASFVAGYFPHNALLVYIAAFIIAICFAGPTFRMYDRRREKKELKKKLREERKANDKQD